MTVLSDFTAEMRAAPFSWAVPPYRVSNVPAVLPRNRRQAACASPPTHEAHVAALSTRRPFVPPAEDCANLTSGDAEATRSPVFGVVPVKAASPEAFLMRAGRSPQPLSPVMADPVGMSSPNGPLGVLRSGQGQAQSGATKTAQIPTGRNFIKAGG